MFSSYWFQQFKSPDSNEQTGFQICVFNAVLINKPWKGKPQPWTSSMKFTIQFTVISLCCTRSFTSFPYLPPVRAASPFSYKSHSNEFSLAYMGTPGIIQHLHMFRVHMAVAPSSPFSMSFFFPFFFVSFSFLLPSIPPSLSSVPMLCRGKIDTAFSARSVWECAHRQDYSQRRRQQRTIKD